MYVCGAAAQIDRWLSIFLEVTSANNKGVRIHYIYNGNINAEQKRCQAASLTGSPVSLDVPNRFWDQWREKLFSESEAWKKVI